MLLCPAIVQASTDSGMPWEDPLSKVVDSITEYTDNTGSQRYNQMLSRLDLELIFTKHAPIRHYLNFG